MYYLWIWRREYVVVLVVLGSTRHAPSSYRSGDEICPGGAKNGYALPRSEERKMRADTVGGEEDACRHGRRRGRCAPPRSEGGRCAPPRSEERKMRAATVGGREMRAATVELRSGAAWRRRHTLRVRLRVSDRV
jgi:hypothetical protein